MPKLEAFKSFSASDVTLAVPCFNAAQYLERVLSSIVSNLSKVTSQAPAQILIIDDGSTDGTLKISEGFAAKANFKIIRHPHNQGLGAARQTALKATETEWLAMVDSDVEVSADWLAALIKTANTHCAVGVGGDLIESETKSIADKWRARMMAQTHGGAEKIGINLFGCNTLHRVATLLEVGGFNPRYTKAYEDIDISQRLIKAGHKLVYTPTARCFHLRKDTVTTVLRSAFAWRLPRNEEQSVYEDLSVHMGKWVSTFKEDLRELHMLLEEGEESAKGELSFPCLVQLFANPIQDLSVIATRSQSMSMRSLCGVGTAMILVVLKQSLLAEELKAKVGVALKPFIDTLTSAIARISVANEASPEMTRVVNATINPWASVLAFSPEHSKRLLASAMLC